MVEWTPWDSIPLLSYQSTVTCKHSSDAHCTDAECGRRFIDELQWLHVWALWTMKDCHAHVYGSPAGFQRHMWAIPESMRRHETWWSCVHGLFFYILLARLLWSLINPLRFHCLLWLLIMVKLNVCIRVLCMRLSANNVWNKHTNRQAKTLSETHTPWHISMNLQAAGNELERGSSLDHRTTAQSLVS